MNFWLVIATSARMLAQAAQREGYDVLAIDCYADVDTKRYAKQVIRVDSLSIENIKAALKPLEKYTITGVIYGSGFETYPESLYFLQCRFRLLGNSPDIFERVQNKKTFFAALQTLDISYPETQFNLPASSHSQTWLSKPLNGQGGVGISFDNSNKTHVYWQRYCEGQAGSILFLAHKNKTTVIGFHRQWSQSIGENNFLFAGICHDDFISKTYQVRITDWVQKLTDYFDLCGLNSLDFIQTKNEILVLEINSRPSASMQLYDAPLFSMHIRANLHCPPLKIGLEKFAAYQIIYASQTLIIPRHFNWSVVCQDLPHAGAIIRKNNPVCSMITCEMQIEFALKKIKN